MKPVHYLHHDLITYNNRIYSAIFFSQLLELSPNILYFHYASLQDRIK